MTKEERMKERAKTVMAMERIVRCINCESYIDSWLMCGVADGDITDDTTVEDVVQYYDSYLEDAEFKDLMTLFLKLMRKAGTNGGLYEDGIVSAEAHLEWD